MISQLNKTLHKAQRHIDYIHLYKIFSISFLLEEEFYLELGFKQTKNCHLNGAKACTDTELFIVTLASS